MEFSIDANSKAFRRGDKEKFFIFNLAMSRTIHALLIGIDDYPVPAHRLRGCIADRDAMRDYLQGLEAEDLSVRLRLLGNEEAGRRNVIEAFRHFEAAGDGDTCLLFFSGHGSRMPSPEAFWHIDLDRRCESLVCWDSRLPGGRDLADKELSYLIWQATQGKDVHFTAIFDCCHAGSVSRDINDNPAVIRRMAEFNASPVELRDFTGYERYRREGERRSPPVGRHLALSACRPEESSVELRSGDGYRGLFTSALLEVLQLSDLRYLSYRELMARTQTRVHNRISSQHPQLDAYGGAAADQLFLDGAARRQPVRVVRYDERHGWVADLGALHGVERGGRALIRDGAAQRAVRVQATGPAYCSFEGMDWAQRGVDYYLDSIDLARPTLSVALAPDTPEPERWKRELQLAGGGISAGWQLSESPESADYWVRTGERGWQLTKPYHRRPVFKTIPHDERRHATGPLVPALLFTQNVARVAAWEATSRIANPLSRIRVTEELDIRLFEVTEHRQFREFITREEKIRIGGKEGEPMQRDTFDEAPFFSYRYEEKERAWKEPGLMLEIRNRSRRRLYLGALFFSEDYAITDQFMPVRPLDTGSEPYAFSYYDASEGYTYRILPLFLPDELHAWGETEITNLIKVFVSTDAFTLDDFNQEGLELESAPTRGAGFRGIGRPPRAGHDWTTIDLSFRIYRPQEGRRLSAGQPLTLNRLRFEEHPTLSAGAVRLSSSAEATRGAEHLPPHMLGGDDHLHPVDLAGSRATAYPLDVIELHAVKGAEGVHAGQPLRLALEGVEAPVLPLGYDAAGRRYRPLGGSAAGGRLRLDTLPDATPSTAAGLGESRKIFLLAKESPIPTFPAR